MKKYLISIIPGILLFGLFYFGNSGETNLLLRDWGRISFLYITLALFITPIVTLTGNQKLLPYRRTLGVISFFLALIHAAVYFQMEYAYQGTFFVAEHFKYLDVISGLIGLAIIIILGITSNNFSVNLLKSYWGKIQSLTYPLFVIVALHVAFASRFDNFYIFVTSVLVLTRTLAYFKNSGNSLNSGKPRYLCVPCGYIYDEDLGDPDSGIKTGTKWEDIPDSWKCPVCGVSKGEFILIGEHMPEEKKIEATIVSKEFLTADVIELKVNPEAQFGLIPGQFATFIWKDETGEFKRSYSVVGYENGILTFLIKVSKEGRGGKILLNINAGEKVYLGGINGEFRLKNNSNKKVFLATGTGLAPIYCMIDKLDKTGVKSNLYFGVRNIEDIIYFDKLDKLKNLDYKIYCSKLEGEGTCNIMKGRMNVDEFEYPPNTDFYICGNPEITKSAIEKLKEKGYNNIYHEQF